MKFTKKTTIIIAIIIIVVIASIFFIKNKINKATLQKKKEAAISAQKLADQAKLEAKRKADISAADASNKIKSDQAAAALIMAQIAQQKADDARKEHLAEVAKQQKEEHLAQLLENAKFHLGDLVYINPQTGSVLRVFDNPNFYSVKAVMSLNDLQNVNSPIAIALEEVGNNGFVKVNFAPGYFGYNPNSYNPSANNNVKLPVSGNLFVLKSQIQKRSAGAVAQNLALTNSVEAASALIPINH